MDGLLIEMSHIQIKSIKIFFLNSINYKVLETIILKLNYNSLLRYELYIVVPSRVVHITIIHWYVWPIWILSI